MADDFYIGYREQAPPATARFVRRTVAVLVVAAGVVAVVLAAGQEPFDPGTFEYGVERDFDGVLFEAPYPMLAIRSSAVDPPAPPSLALLVAPGKHGAAPLVAGLDGRGVRLRGSRIERGGNLMIEVVPGTIEAAPAPQPSGRPARRSLGSLALRGEIVDSKCFLGVMKPGRGKPHRDCAARCLAGGAPPLLWVPAERDGYVFLLVDERGRALAGDLGAWVGERVAIEGRLERQGELLVLAADPATWRRLE